MKDGKQFGLFSHKNPKISDTRKTAVIIQKFEQGGLKLYRTEMHPKDADGMTNSVDPDQTAPMDLHCLPRPACPKT